MKDIDTATQGIIDIVCEVGDKYSLLNVGSEAEDPLFCGDSFYELRDQLKSYLEGVFPSQEKCLLRIPESVLYFIQSSDRCNDFRLEVPLSIEIDS